MLVKGFKNLLNLLAYNFKTNIMRTYNLLKRRNIYKLNKSKLYKSKNVILKDQNNKKLNKCILTNNLSNMKTKIIKINYETNHH